MPAIPVPPSRARAGRRRPSRCPAQGARAARDDGARGGEAPLSPGGAEFSEAQGPPSPASSLGSGAHGAEAARRCGRQAPEIAPEAPGCGHFQGQRAAPAPPGSHPSPAGGRGIDAAILGDGGPPLLRALSDGTLSPRSESGGPGRRSFYELLHEIAAVFEHSVASARCCSEDERERAVPPEGRELTLLRPLARRCPEPPGAQGPRASDAEGIRHSGRLGADGICAHASGAPEEAGRLAEVPCAEGQACSKASAFSEPAPVSFGAVRAATAEFGNVDDARAVDHIALEVADGEEQQMSITRENLERLPTIAEALSDIASVFSGEEERRAAKKGADAPGLSPFDDEVEEERQPSGRSSLSQGSRRANEGGAAQPRWQSDGAARPQEGSIRASVGVASEFSLLSFCSRSDSSSEGEGDALARGGGASGEAPVVAQDAHGKIGRARALTSAAAARHAQSDSGSVRSKPSPASLSPPRSGADTSPAVSPPNSFHQGHSRLAAPAAVAGSTSSPDPSPRSSHRGRHHSPRPEDPRRRRDGGEPSVDTLVSIASHHSSGSGAAMEAGTSMNMKSSGSSVRAKLQAAAAAAAGVRHTSFSPYTSSASQPQHHQAPQAQQQGGSAMSASQPSVSSAARAQQPLHPSFANTAPSTFHHVARSPTLNDFMSLRVDAGAGTNQFTQVATLSNLPIIWQRQASPPPGSAAQQSHPQRPGPLDMCAGNSYDASVSGCARASAQQPYMSEMLESGHEGEEEASRSEAKNDVDLSILDDGNDGVRFHLVPCWAMDEAPQMRRRSSRMLTMRSARLTVSLNASEEDEKVLNGHTCLQRFLVHPSSMKRLAWDLIGMSLLCWDVLVIPFTQAFNPPGSTFLSVMGLITMGFWSTDILASFVTGFQEKKYVVMAPGRIARRYLRSWFFLDLPVVSLDWFMLFAQSDGADTASDVSKSFRTLRFMRVLRLVRMLKMLKVIQVIRDLIDTEAISICFDIAKITVILVMVNHFVACGWYAVGTIRAKENNGLTWVGNNDMEDRSLVYRYATSLHWSLGQFAGASVETVPQSPYERVYAVLVSLAAMITFSSFISILTASMAELRRISTDEIRQFWLLRRYLRDWAVSRAVAQRVSRYAEYMYQRQKQQVQTKDVFLLTLLSEPLREELRNETLSCHLNVHPLFGNRNMHTRIFSKAVCEVSLARGDAVFLCGEQARAINFVTNNGMVQYQIAHCDGAAVEHALDSEYVGDGTWICEAALWTVWSHLGDAHAVTESQIVCVSSEVFGSCLQSHTWLWMAVKQYAENFVEELNHLPVEKLTDLMHKVITPEDFLEQSGFETNAAPVESEAVVPVRSRRSLQNLVTQSLSHIRSLTSLTRRPKEAVDPDEMGE